MLTDAQKLVRATGIGASEAGEVLEIHPSRQPIDCWLRKTGRSTDEEESEASELGSAIEDGLRTLYTQRTGRRMDRVGETLRHPEHPTILASPDGLSPDEDLGLELKCIGFNMRHHWEGDSIPDYVLTQAAQNMAVTGRAAWDVGRLIGTDFQIYRIERDIELEAEMLSTLVAWWADHVVADVAPPALDPDARRKWLRTRYPGSDRTKCIQAHVSETDVGEAMRWLDWWDRVKAIGEQASKKIENELCDRIGDEYGIESDAGRFLWYPRRGNPDWKAIAHALGGGAVPADLVEQHRGEGTRVPRLYMSKPKVKRITK